MAPLYSRYVPPRASSDTPAIVQAKSETTPKSFALYSRYVPPVISKQDLNIKKLEQLVENDSVPHERQEEVKNKKRKRSSAPESENVTSDMTTPRKEKRKPNKIPITANDNDDHVEEEAQKHSGVFSKYQKALQNAEESVVPAESADEQTSAPELHGQMLMVVVIPKS